MPKDPIIGWVLALPVLLLSLILIIALIAVAAH